MGNKIKKESNAKYFSHLFPRIKDAKRRKVKADKVKYLLNTYTNFDLRNSICLDIGCSTGAMTFELADLFNYIIGIDLDVEALLVGLSDNNILINDHINLINANIMDLPIKNETIDVIICSQVYEHVQNDLILVKEMYRVLKPKGLIFFSGPNRSFPFEFHYNLPFIHWLPNKLENDLLMIFSKGNKLYERIKTKKELKELFTDFYIEDLSFEVIKYYIRNNIIISFILNILPINMINNFSFLMPNFNWILKKSQKDYFEINEDGLPTRQI